MNIQENISLKPLNTFGIAKNARFFTAVDSEMQLKQALVWAKNQNQNVLILGGGSNILLTKDFDGLVIKIEIKGINLIREDENYTWVKVGAGEGWHDLVRYAIDKNWAGIENLSLIPGTVGASPMQNIGAYGVEIKEVFESLDALNRSSVQMETFSAEACKFGYRESVFKHELKDQYVICTVVFRLKKKPDFRIEYGAIHDVLKEKGITELSIKAVSDAVSEIRMSKLPDPKKIGNAGSFFKNPTISQKQFIELRSVFPEMPGYPTPDGVKVPAGWLIEQAGWKGKRIGEVGVHAKQALVLVNYGNGEGSDIKALSEKVGQSVMEKFKVQLQPEVNFI
ncbi:UDP-N-acetylmuramate dehydrogenase [Algoriphagus alkaliphilus]|uniref:UDP-N-acetylenolpyruvoylglucosamine reductase n=1 Tax=Algoriphagus alkaliphilus TaxID=279824 RepID=A0A1G5Z1B6_9BACT|nr:UDP-N-acetylmuramate dehydrogenase [Algoriphagus alkaliphilus]MBA4298650.1 UDP-N-acetylmuramate dehydrogenase [Cyclobacterium sp.]SDA88247.1 UDP-N-acetylmuramate dehydrogenase [Algoriphagus alkaliphilus]